MSLRREAMRIIIKWDDDRGNLVADERAQFDHDTLECLYALLVGGAHHADGSAER